MILLLIVYGCKKAEPKGNSILNEEFDIVGEWLLYSEFDANDSVFSRIENSTLQLKTFSNKSTCQRATYEFKSDTANKTEIKIAAYFNELVLPENTMLQIYFSLGLSEFRVIIKKSISKKFTLWIKYKNEKVSTNLRGLIFDKLSSKKEKDNEELNFIQFSLCGSDEIIEPELMYLEIEKLIVTAN